LTDTVGVERKTDIEDTKTR